MIFTFSATGNSYHVARLVSEATGVPKTDLAAAVRYKRFLYDAKGETVLSRKRLMNSNTIDFMNTPSGVYILKLNLGGSEKSYKIIKKQ